MSKVITILVILCCLVGCIGKEEIDDLAMVMSFAIDKNEENNNLIITAQIARPGNVTGDTGGGGEGEPIWTATSEGETIFEAIRNLARFSSRRVFWAHNFIIVVSEKVAREDGLVDIIDFFNRNNELRMRTWVVISEKDARELVATKTGLEIVPGMSLDRLFRYSDIVSEAPRSDVMTLTSAYLGEHTHPYLAMVNIRDRGINTESPEEFGSIPQVELSGTAIFKDDKMVGKLTAEESRGFLWFIDKIESAIVPLSCPEQNDRRTSVELRENKFNISPYIENDTVKFEATVKTKPHLVELGCLTSKEHSEIVTILEEKVEAAIIQDIEIMLAKVQKEFKSDVLQLGRTFEGKYPGQWKEMESSWDDIYPNVEVKISVKSDIKNTLLLENPTRPAKD
ncbi:Ger(x)C family spore germination protein [Evansella sp. AB-P1]|uniref:Ger(x)C family spore germination protein n=1 Tax=Evansella sp. AB-P1 TaxID=3037653 RepID=UPI00241D6B57|nr:Ger(x)C family spore germination protein [Evansella sp. AB-P1]MDG5789950.1 Ger(x)C family spore germination protein [Evansella sp. AB-P1]